MKDRTPRYPGRIKLTHEDGTVEYVTMERADDPVEPGTPLNKATLLTEETGEMLGLDDTATVNDALQRIILSAAGDSSVSTDLEELEIRIGAVTTSGTTTVQFQRPFSGTPYILAYVPSESTLMFALISNVTSEGFKATIKNVNGTILNGHTLNYIAIYDGGETV